jgi:hypothetical protein
VTAATQRAGPRSARHSPSHPSRRLGSGLWHSSGPSGALHRSKGCGPHSGRVPVRNPVPSLEDRPWTAWDRYPRGTCPARMNVFRLHVSRVPTCSTLRWSNVQAGQRTAQHQCSSHCSAYLESREAKSRAESLTVQQVWGSFDCNDIYWAPACRKDVAVEIEI